MKRLVACPDGGVIIAAAVSAAGLIAHNLVEFPVQVLVGAETMLPFGVTVALVAAWLRRRRRRMLHLLAAWAGVHLVFGGLSVLPLPLAPFEPEQTVSHYVAHAVYAAAQVPLLWLGIRPPTCAASGPRLEE